MEVNQPASDLLVVRCWVEEGKMSVAMSCCLQALANRTQNTGHNAVIQQQLPANYVY